MAKPAASRPENFRRYRISVPIDDKEVCDWIEMQSNLSFSMRELIKAAIKDSGMKDVTCGIQDIRVILGLSRIAEAYQVGLGALPATAIVEQAIKSSGGSEIPGARLPASAPQMPTETRMPMQEPAKPAQPQAPAPASPGAGGYPTPPAGGEQEFKDPGDLLND